MYGFDTGFVRTFRGWGEVRDEDLGVLWEHYVLNELQARATVGEIRYWRSTKHQEVDLVVVRRGHAPLAVECKWRTDDREDLPGLRAFLRAYPKAEARVVASDIERPFEREVVPGNRVRYVGLEGLLEDLVVR